MEEKKIENKKEELTILEFASVSSKNLMKLLKFAFIIITIQAVIFVGAIIYIINVGISTTETTTLTTEADITSIQGKDSTITTYPNTSTNTNGNTNK